MLNLMPVMNDFSNSIDHIFKPSAHHTHNFMSSFRSIRRKCQNLGISWRRKKKLCSSWLDFDTKSVKHFNGNYLDKSCWVDFADDKYSFENVFFFLLPFIYSQPSSQFIFSISFRYEISCENFSSDEPTALGWISHDIAKRQAILYIGQQPIFVLSGNCFLFVLARDFWIFYFCNILLIMYTF